MTILITGVAGFIGFHTSNELIKKYKVVGIDNLNKYYDVNLKRDRLKILKKNKKFIFEKIDISDKKKIEKLFQKFKFKYVINLAAQAGVRYSLVNPHSYLKSNINGFLNILENCKKHKIKHLLYASSSSVYGANKLIPFSEVHQVGHPVSLYAATKRSNELMAHTYSHLFNLPTTGLRFFTVYGPMGRPDMAIYIFVKNILNNKSININNYGNMSRDFTYIDDVVSGIKSLISKIPKKKLSNKYSKINQSVAPFRIYNIGNNKPEKLMNVIKIIEKELNLNAKKNYKPMQMGDVQSTYANIKNLKKICNYSPSTNIKDGIKKFIEWYKIYNNFKVR